MQQQPAFVGSEVVVCDGCDGDGDAAAATCDTKITAGVARCDDHG